MLDQNEAAFLQTIAEDQADDAARLVFADWVEEHGDSPRAEFLRVQCELAAPKLAEKRRHALRLRERELLDAHRRQWCESLGLSVEDVGFERGLVSKMRLANADWQTLLDPACAQRLVTLTELDLSGLHMPDAGAAALAKAHFPALRKLLLSNNDITNAGATALASAEGLPRLDTVYLFQNPATDAARRALERSKHFHLSNLDMGEREEGYCMSPGEAEVARRQYVREHLLPVVRRYFEKYPRLQSAMLCVAQYWADEANDAVHGTLIVSELFEPTLKGVNSDDDETSVDPNLPNTHIPSKFSKRSSSEIWLWEEGSQWEDNNGAIPLWAAFAPEEGSQETGLEENYLPAVMFYRHGGYEILPMARPHLDGIRPEWGAED